MNKLPLHIIDYAIIILSLFLSAGFGLLFSKGQKTTNKYFKADGKIPAWAIGLSILATLVSSITFLAYPGSGYSNNWILLVQGLMVPVVLLFVIWGVVPLYRKVIGLSAYEYFEKRFGYLARLYTSLGFAFVHFTKMGTVFYLLGVALAKMTGIDIMYIIWILTIVIIFLTLIGGIEAVIWLDVIQGFLLIAGGIICLLILLFTTEGGPAVVWETAKANGRTGFGPFDWDFVHLTFWVMAINGVFYAIQKYGTDQTVVQRYLTAKSDKDAIKASFIGILLTVPVWALFMFIGTALFSYYKVSGAVLPPGTSADGVFPYFIMTELPVGIAGLVLSALIAAAISTLDADLNCLSAVGVQDYYSKLRPDATEKQKMRISRIMVVVFGVSAAAIASMYVRAGSEGVLGFVFELYAIFSGGIAGLFLLGLFSKRANRQGAYIGIAATILFTAYAVMTSTSYDFGDGKKLIVDLGRINFHQHKYMLGVYSHIILFVVGWIASLFFKTDTSSEGLTIHEYYKRKKKAIQVSS